MPVHCYCYFSQARVARACSGLTQCHLSSVTSTTSATTRVETTSRSGCRQLLHCQWCQLVVRRFRHTSVAVLSAMSLPTQSLFTVRRTAFPSVLEAGAVSGSATVLPWWDFVLQFLYTFEWFCPLWGNVFYDWYDVERLLTPRNTTTFMTIRDATCVPGLNQLS